MIKKLLFFTGMIISALYSNTAFSNDASSSCSLENHKQLKVAYLEYRESDSANLIFNGIVRGLVDDGYMPDFDIRLNENFHNPEKYKEILVDNLSGGCIKFVPNGYFSANYDDEKLRLYANEILARSMSGEIDTVITSGVLATKAMMETGISIPVISFTTRAGVIELSQATKTKKNLHVTNDNRSVVVDVNSFIRFLGYKHIGFMREKSYKFDYLIDYKELNSFFEKNNQLDLEICEGTFFTADKALAMSEFERCVLDLKSKKIDVLVLTDLGNAIDINKLYTQIRPLIENKIAVVSFDSQEEVRAGSMISIYDRNLKTYIPHATNILEKIFNGVPVSEIPREVNAPLFLGLNLRTAGLVQWKPSFDVLVGVDDVYQTISSD